MVDVRCRCSCWGTNYLGYPTWCPHARKARSEDAKNFKEFNQDYRCLGWLYVCNKTGKIVVHNKKCDVPSVVKTVEFYTDKDSLHSKDLEEKSHGQ